MIGLDGIDLLGPLIISTSFDQCSVSKQSQHHCHRGRCSRPFVPWDLLIMRAQVQVNLALDETGDQYTQHRAHRQGDHPFRLLQPYRADGRWVLDPSQTRFSCRVLLLIGLENLGIRTDLSAYRRGQHGPAIVLIRMG